MKALKIKFVNEFTDDEKKIIMPARHSNLASGLDLVSADKEDYLLAPGERTAVSTGVAIELEKGFEAQIRSRSGLSLKHGIIALNAPGTIDADYRGEIKIILANLSTTPFTVSFGMRIGQMVVAPVILPELVVVAELSDTTRQEKGFGSTGLVGN